MSTTRHQPDVLNDIDKALDNLAAPIPKAASEAFPEPGTPIDARAAAARLTRVLVEHTRVLAHEAEYLGQSAAAFVPELDRSDAAQILAELVALCRRIERLSEAIWVKSGHAKDPVTPEIESREPHP
jgi:hypothetical protein